MPAIDSAPVLAAAVEHGLLTPETARELRKPIKQSGQPAIEFLVERDRLTPIQAEALEGLLRPESVAEGYVIEGLLGYGGIGVVYRARQPSLDRQVALKTIRVARFREGGSQSTLGRFEQEARAIARLQHPGIVTAYDYGAKPERLYLAMELVDGEDLDGFIKRHDRVAEATAWQLTRQAAAALEHALQAGVVHRDIKPANLLLCEPPAGYPLPPGVPLLKVTDFGLAKLSGSRQAPDSTRLTIAGATMGTPHYMAPEQIEHSAVDHRADVYALGATAWHMVAGEPPLAGLSMMKIFAAKVAGEGVCLDDLPPDVSAPSRALLAEMLRHEADDRLADYAELIDRIDRIQHEPTDGETVLLTSPAPTLPVRAQPAATPAQAAPPSREPNRRRRLRPLPARVLMAIGGLVAIGVAAVMTAGAPRLFAPPTPELVAGTGGSALLSGGSLTGWQNADLGSGAHAGYYRTRRNASRAIAAERQELPQPDHFRLQLRIALDGAEALEVWFEPGRDPKTKQPRGVILAIRVGGQSAMFGRRENDAAEFEPLGEAHTLGGEDEVVLVIDRDTDWWFVSERRPGESSPRRIGAHRHAAGPPDEVRFNPVGGEPWVGDLELIPLTNQPAGGGVNG